MRISYAFKLILEDQLAISQVCFEQGLIICRNFTAFLKIKRVYTFRILQLV